MLTPCKNLTEESYKSAKLVLARVTTADMHCVLISFTETDNQSCIIDLTLSLSSVANARPSSDSSTMDDASDGPTATNRKRVASATSVSSSTTVGDRKRKYAMTRSSRKSTCPTSKLAHSVPAGSFRVSRLFG